MIGFAQELKLRSAVVEQYRGFLKKRTEEYEGCMAAWVVSKRIEGCAGLQFDLAPIKKRRSSHLRRWWTWYKQSQKLRV